MDAWIGFMWFNIGADGRLLLSRYQHCKFHNWWTYSSNDQVSISNNKKIELIKRVCCTKLVFRAISSKPPCKHLPALARGIGVTCHIRMLPATASTVLSLTHSKPN